MRASRLGAAIPRVTRPRDATRPRRTSLLPSAPGPFPRIHTLVRTGSLFHARRAIWLKHSHRHNRGLFTEAVPAWLMPPGIFFGLLLGLWTWKCFWIIVMQDKLLYLSWLPPFSRSEQISDYASACLPVRWTEHTIRSLDGTKLTVCQGYIPATSNHAREKQMVKKNPVIICYFQGNGGSTPLRLPLLSQVLKALATDTTSINPETSYVVVALSYRGYWTSSGRASQSGLEADAQAFLEWVAETFSPCQVVLWGHSLGSAVAAHSLVHRLSQQNGDIARTNTMNESLAPIRGLIMEAPISNIKGMLISLYPQKWLPYRYMWPFSWNNWCNFTNLERLASRSKRGDIARQSTVPRTMDRKNPPILILSAEKDEVIPPEVAEQLEYQGLSLDLNLRRQDIAGAMHTEIPFKLEGRNALVRFISSTTRQSQ